MTDYLDRESERNFDDYVHKRISWREYHEKDYEIRKKKMNGGGHY